MNLFIVTVEGVYRHEILGVFTLITKARIRAQKFLTEEPDNYHSVAIHELVVDQETDEPETIETWIKLKNGQLRRNPGFDQQA